MASEAVITLVPARPALRLSLHAIAMTAGKIVACCVFTIIVGLFGQFANRPLVVGVLDIGHALMAGILIVIGMSAARGRATWSSVGVAACGGALGGAGLALLVVGAQSVSLRWMFVSLLPATLDSVGYELPQEQAFALLTVAGAGITAFGAVLPRLAPRLRVFLLGALGGVVFVGLLRELARSLMTSLWIPDNWAFDYDGMLLPGAAVSALLGGVTCLRPGARWFAGLPAAARLAIRLAALLLVLALPVLTNDFVAQMMMLVCLYILMGLGLNIELGLAGLVDLGFVAFFAVGAYTVALLTADGSAAFLHINVFFALPFAVVTASLAGFLFGLPVLRVRGDYLAIATLGLGEIIRVLVLSDMLKPLLGGAQGIVNIPKPSLFGFSLSTPTYLFYMTAVLACIAGYIAWRLQYSGLGRRWLAVREDEDAAQALGINLVQVKLSAYTLGAAFAGLAGGVFASMVGSVFPQSFQLVISINVLAILVVGGIGSLSGVVVGAAALIGAPEVLRDLGEYRYLVYGLVVIAIVRLKPEGLSPVKLRRREAA